MADSSAEKTEKPTAKKRKDARNEGQVLKSQEVNVAFCSIVMFTLMISLWPSYMRKMMEVFRDYLNAGAILPQSEQLTFQVFSIVFRRALFTLLGIVLPVVATAMVAGLVINLLQVGFLFTTKPIKPKLSKINPIKGFQRLFSIRTLTELVKSILKIVVIGYVAYREYRKFIERAPFMMSKSIYESCIEFMTTAFQIALKMAAFLVIIAGLDYLFQWWKHEKDLKMTKQEVKDEYKQQEGDPQIKGKIRSKQRQMSAMRMMEKVPTADVVITNPTHLAIALKYEEGVSDAPEIIAKGQDFLARKIKETAIENDIMIVEDVPLAHALYDNCEVGDVIPQEFYQAVADILVTVYRAKNKIR